MSYPRARGLVAAFLLLSSGPGWSQADEFPIGAWFPGLFQADSTQWAARLNSVVADSFNTIHASMSGYPRRSNLRAAENAGWMREADSRDLNIQLHSWWQPPGWRSHSANYWSRTLEAEHARFRHHTGTVTADGRYAEAATTDSPGDSPGLLLDTPIQAEPPAELRLRMLTEPRLDQHGNQVRDRNGNAIIDTVARFGVHVFWLRTDDNSGADTLATLRVLSGTTVVASLVVEKQDFMTTTKSESFPVRYPNTSNRFPVRYQVDWTGAGNLLVDKIQLHDHDPPNRHLPRLDRAMRLFRGDRDTAIKDSLAAYDGMAAPEPWRFYLYDEPRRDLNESVAYVNDFIKAEHSGKSGVVAVNLRHDDPDDHRDLLRNYIDTVQPSELLVDYYTFGTRARVGDPARLDRLAYWYGNARAVALEKSLPLWVCVQAHSWTDLRDVTADELRAQVNLALAHGAKGIYYFMLSSHTDTDAATELDGLYTGTWGPTSKSAAARSLNHMLQALAPTYLALTSTAVFPGDELEGFVHRLSDRSDYRLGTFTHTDNSRYLMVVNERCAPGDTRTVTVTLDTDDLAGRPGSEREYRVFDVYADTRTPAPVSQTSGEENLVSFPVTLAPGGGRLYRIEAVRPDQPGEVELTWEGGEVRATLTDKDEPKQKRKRDRAWQWQRRPEDHSTDWANIRGATKPSYTPVEADDGHELRTTVSYLDLTSVDDDDRKTAESPETEVVRLPRVSFGAASYTAAEGGRPIGAEATTDPVWARITVQVLAAANATIEIPIPSVRIPITVTPVGETDTTDYRVRGLPKANRLRLSASEPEGVFTIEGLREADLADETVQLGFGELPEAVVAGATATATVTIHDTPNKPVDLTASPGAGQVTLQWAEPPPEAGIAGWQYRTAKGKQWGDWMPLDPATLKVPVPELTNGVMYRFRVRAFNQHGYGEVATTTATPNGLQATAYRGAVVLAWADGGRTDVARWEYQVKRSSKKKWGGWQAARVDASPQTETVRNLTDGKAYDFQVQGLTAGGEVAVTWPAVKATPKAALEPPPNEEPSTPEGPAAVKILEGDDTDTKADYTSTDPEGSTVQWSLTGEDAGALQISAAGRLSFPTAPDYETPTDKNKDRIYRVSVVASDGALSSLPWPVTVEVEDVDEPGTVRIALPEDAADPAGPPQVWHRLQATVTDPDGVRNPKWEWQRQPFAGGPYGAMSMPKYGKSSAYVVQEADVCYRLRVTVIYEDRHGADTLRTPDGAQPVIHTPGSPPNLTALAGDEAVTLSWDEASGHCSAITHYQSRHRPRKDEATGTWVDEWTAWATVAVAAGQAEALARSQEVTGLANGRRYSFSVRAVNGAGEGMAWTVSATPMASGPVVLGPDTTKVGERHAGVVATFKVAEKHATWASLAGADHARFTLTRQVGAADTVLGLVEFKQVPNYEGPDDHDHDREYELEIVARKGAERSAPHSFVVVVENRRDPGFITLAPPRPRPGQIVVATLADEDGGVVGKPKWMWTGGQAVDAVQGGQTVSLHAESRRATSADMGKRIQVKARYVDNFGADSALAVTDTILDVPGRVENLTGTPGDREVTLRWDPAPDGGSEIQHYEWRQHLGGPRWTEWAPLLPPQPSDPPPRTVTVTGLSNGTAYPFEVRAKNDIGKGPAESVTATPATVPEAPPDFQASPGNARVTLTWGEAANGGDAITHYETRHRRSDRTAWGSWSTVAGNAAARSRTISSLTNGQEYAFQVRAENGVGDGAAADTLATPVAPRPQITGPDTTKVGERHAGVVDTFKVADTGGRVTWEPLAGRDGAKFTLTRQVVVGAVLGLVKFKKAPDYEAPDDHDHDREYEVRIVARRGTLRSAAHDFVAVVENRDDPGTITLSPSAPRIGETVTATLVDTDSGVRDTVWTWPRHGGVSGQQYPSIRTSKEKVGRNDLGKRLRATVTYTDNHGSGKSASATTQDVRANKPGPVGSLTASRGNGQVTLTWTAAANNGASIDYYEYRQGTSGSFSRIGSGHTARNARSKTVTGLTNGTSYTFQVRAHNAVGDGPAVSVTATPATRPGVPPSFRATPGNARVALTWGAAASGGDAITHYETRHRRSDRTAWGSWSTVSGGAGARSRTISSLTNGQGYVFQVRAENGVGDGAAAEAPATPVAPNRAPTVSGPATPSVPENGAKKVATYTLSDPDAGDALSWRPLGGAQASAFELKPLSPPQARKRELHFRSTPNHEARERYAVKVIGRDRAGRTDTLAVTVTVTDVNERPSVSGSATAQVPERTKKVGTYTGSDPDGDALTWSVRGDDGSRFELKQLSPPNARKRELHFKSTPYYNGSDYSAAVRVEDPDGLAASQSVEVEVTDVDDRGSVSLSPSSPRVGQTVTATLIDTDGGVRDTSWTWTRHGGIGGQQYPSIRTSKEKVGRNDLGKQLRATVTYTDNHGEGKSATAITNAVKANRPGPVGTLTASGGDGRVTLSWTAAANNGSSIDYYEYRQGTSGSFSRIGSGHTARNARSKTVTGLTNGTAYTFQVRAHNAVGSGPAVSAKATPAGKPSAPKSLSAARGDRQATLTWGAADANGSAVTHYEYRRMREGAAAWSSWFTISGGGSTRSRTMTGLTNGTGYTFQIRAENGAGAGPAASVTVTPAGRPGAPKNLTTARPGTRKVSITWTAADDNGSPITAYQYRRRAGASTTWRGWFTVSGGGSARTRTVSGLGDFTQYTWEVRAKNDIGYGPSASVVTSPRGPGGPAGQGGGEPDNEGDNEGEPDTPMEDGGPSAKPVALGDGGGELAVTTAPNPFNDTTTLRLQLPEAARVLLTLHNLAGQVVAVLVDAELAAGTHVREWDGRDDRGRASASGLYLYRLLAGQRILTGKLALIR